MKEQKLLMNIATSICMMNNWEMERLDIQKYDLGDFSGYSGYLYVNGTTYIIRTDGSFEERHY